MYTYNMACILYLVEIVDFLRSRRFLSPNTIIIISFIVVLYVGVIPVRETITFGQTIVVERGRG